MSGSIIAVLRGWIEFADEASNEVANRDRMATPWGDVIAIPAAANGGGGGRRKAAAGFAQGLDRTHSEEGF